MSNLISPNTSVEGEWQKHWKLLVRKPVITEPEKKAARPRRKTPPHFDCRGLPEAIATILREFAGLKPSPQDARYRVALACRDYLSAFYELAIDNSSDCNSSKEEASQKVEGGFPVRRNRRNLKSDWMQDAFEELVGRYDREQELGRRQRSNYANLFNELGQKLQACYSQFPLQAVHNYSRSPRHMPVTAAANLSIPPSYYDRVMAVLERDTLYPPSKTELELTDQVAGTEPEKAKVRLEETAHAERFARFALLLMLRLGVTFRGVVAAICRMELRDLNLEKGFVMVYHKASRRTWIPVWLDDLTALALYSLIAHCARNDRYQVRKRLIQPQSPRTLLATWEVLADPQVLSTSTIYNDLSEEEDRDMDGEDNSGDEAEETASSLSTAQPGSEQTRKAIETHFKTVCQRAGLELPITLVQMLHTTRWVLNERSAFGLTKTGAVIAMLSGFIKPGFFTEDMLTPEWTIQPPPWLAGLLTPKPKVSSRNRRSLAYGVKNPKTGSGSEKLSQVTSSLSSSLNRKSTLLLQEEEEDIHKAASLALRQAMCELDDHSSTLNRSETGLSRGTRRQEDNRQRRQAGKALRQLAGCWLGLESAPDRTPGHSTLVAKLKELYQNSDLSEYEVNLASVACWLAYLSAEQEGAPLRAETLATYRTEALYLLKALPNTRITDYEWEDVEDVLEFDLAENPPIRRKAVVKSIRNYLAGQVGLPLSELDLENTHFSSLSKTTREKILTPTEVWKLLEGLEPERSNKERNLLLAVILGYFGMLRAGEICRLRCGDLVLGSSQPYVRIYNTKCRKSRIMPLDDVPDVLVALLKRLRRDRQMALEVAQGQRGWQRVIGEPLLVSETGQALSPSRLSALVKERLKECGFGETSLHDFRKGGANWRYYSEANMPAADIGKRLGHSGLMVTFKCYLKGLDLVQREMAHNLHLMPQTVGISSPILSETIPAPTEEWTMPVAKFALLADVSRQQAYNLLDGRKLTLQIVRQILQQEVMSSIPDSVSTPD